MSSGDRSKTNRRGYIAELIADVQRRRAAGVEIADESILEKYPDLLPELEQGLRKLWFIELARQEAESDDAPEQPAGSTCSLQRVSSGARATVFEHRLGLEQGWPRHCEPKCRGCSR